MLKFTNVRYIDLTKVEISLSLPAHQFVACSGSAQDGSGAYPMLAALVQADDGKQQLHQMMVYRLQCSPERAP